MTTFPTDAVRDLIGIVRAMYLARRRTSAGEVELATLAKIGKTLERARVDAGLSAPGSLCYQAAIRQAADAAGELGELVRLTESAEPIVRAAQDRVLLARLARRR